MNTCDSFSLSIMKILWKSFYYHFFFSFFVLYEKYYLYYPFHISNQNLHLFLVTSIFYHNLWFIFCHLFFNLVYIVHFENECLECLISWKYLSLRPVTQVTKNLQFSDCKKSIASFSFRRKYYADQSFFFFSFFYLDFHFTEKRTPYKK